jgi:hypothetical protein
MNRGGAADDRPHKDDAVTTRDDPSGRELFRGVLLVHLILGLHIALVALIGLLVIFFGGIARTWVWILLGGLTAGLGAALYAFFRARARGRRLWGEVRGAAVAPGGSLEVSFLGGVASVTLRRPAGPGPPPAALLEEPETLRLRELSALVDMYEKSLITREEFEKAKGALFNPLPRPPYGPASLEQ